MNEFDLFEDDLYDQGEMLDQYGEEDVWSEDESEDARVMRLLTAFGY